MAKKTDKDAADAKGGLQMSEEAAGAGVLGLLGFAALFACALVFFVIESFFLALLLAALALLVWVSGREFGKLLISSVTVFFSSKHLVRNATYVQETLGELRKVLHLRKDESGFVKVGPIEAGAKVKLPDNPLSRDIQAVLKREKGKEYAEYVAHQYYVDCRELYDHFHSHLEFVAGIMPLFGLIGTVLGMIGMFDTLGGNTKVEALAPSLAVALQLTLWGAVLATVFMVIASRFSQRIRALEYDYQTLAHGLEVLVENKAVVEVQA
jgi:biopolymer transport protein ExbB/TolQ